MQVRRTNRVLTVVALLLSVFLPAMEMTIVSTAMPSVVADLGGIGEYAWVFAVYMLASTVAVPIWGKLADLYGRKPILVGGTCIFLLGSAASGLAPSVGALIAARCFQGLGAGAMQPASQTILGDLFEPDERARMQGAFGAVWGLAGLVGPLLGGLIVHVWSWRWVFFINIPFGLASIAVLVFVFHEPIDRRRPKLDFAGAFLLAVSVLALLSAGTSGLRLLAWPVAVVGVGALVLVERRASEPILPLDLFRKPIVASASVGGAFLGATMTATATFVPLLVQGFLGATPTAAGMAIAPMAIGWPLASAAAGWLLPRTGYRRLVRTGFLVAFAATVMLAWYVGPNATPRGPWITSFLLGVGLGFANTTLLLAVQSSVVWERRGVATASTSLARAVGGTLGVGGLGALLMNGVMERAGVSEAAANSVLGPMHGRDLPPEVAAHVLSTLGQGLGSVFWVIAALAGVALICGVWFPAVPMHAGQRRRRLGADGVVG